MNQIYMWPITQKTVEIELVGVYVKMFICVIFFKAYKYNPHKTTRLRVL